MDKIVAYFKGVKNELTKVTWPTRKEGVRLTIVVIGLTAIFAVLIGVLDLLFTKLVKLLIQ